MKWQYKKMWFFFYTKGFKTHVWIELCGFIYYNVPTSIRMNNMQCLLCTYCIKLQLDIKLWKGQSTGYVNNQSWKVQFRAKNPLISKQLIERNNYWCSELHAHLNPKWQFFFMIHLKFFIHVICLLCTCSFKFEYNCYIMMSTC